MNVNQFANQLSDKLDYGRTNLFQVTIPGTWQDSYNLSEYNGTDLRFMAKAASLPGKSLGTIDVKRFGAIYKVANDAIVDQFSITVLCSGDMKERKFFDAWISGIHGQTKDNYTDGQTNSDLYRMMYYDEYINKVYVESFGRDGKCEYMVELQEAYPTNLGAVDLSWDTGDVATFTVAFTFRNWVEVPPNDYEGGKFGASAEGQARQE